MAVLIVGPQYRYKHSLYLGSRKRSIKRIASVTNALEGKKPPRARLSHFSNIKYVGTMGKNVGERMVQDLEQQVTQWHDVYDGRWRALGRLRAYGRLIYLERQRRKLGATEIVYIGGRL